jgi:hypothetical protein
MVMIVDEMKTITSSALHRRSSSAGYTDAIRHQHSYRPTSLPTRITTTNASSPPLFFESIYLHLFTARNAKLIAFVSLVALFIYHILLQWLTFDSCIGLLTDGRYQGDRFWQPYGCMLHIYDQM